MRATWVLTVASPTSRHGLDGSRHHLEDPSPPVVVPPSTASVVVVEASPPPSVSVDVVADVVVAVASVGGSPSVPFDEIVAVGELVVVSMTGVRSPTSRF